MSDFDAEEWMRLESVKMRASLHQARLQAGLTREDFAAMGADCQVLMGRVENLQDDDIRLSTIRRYAAIVGVVVQPTVLNIKEPEPEEETDDQRQ